MNVAGNLEKISSRLKKTIFLLLCISLFSHASGNFAKTKPVAKAAKQEINQFIDIEAGNRFYLAVKALQEKGIIHGYPDNTFKPNKKLNRAEALKILISASISNLDSELEKIKSNLALDLALDPELEKKLNQNTFSDVNPSDWFYPYLNFANNKKIIKGYEDGTFKPAQNINLAEALKIYFESLPNVIYPEKIKTENLFADTPEESWFTKYTAYAASRSILNISSENIINPEKALTRGELAEIIYKMLTFGQGYDFGKATWYGSATNGSKTSSGEIFNATLLTAAHKTLPFGTIVEATNLANGKSVEVKINDRGPHGPGRVLDLSSGAFNQIASLGAGVINVQYKVISQP